MPKPATAAQVIALTDGARRDELITCRLPSQLAEQIRAWAVRKNSTMSDILLIGAANQIAHYERMIVDEETREAAHELAQKIETGNEPRLVMGELRHQWRQKRRRKR